MDVELFDKFKKQYEHLQTDVSEIKEIAETIIATIEGDSFISIEEADGLNSKLNEYRAKLEAFKATGTKLAITTEASISSIAATIEELELRQSLVSERQMVLDFLRLTADAEKSISRLDIAKVKLTEKCRLDDVKTELEPFRLVIDCVKIGATDISEDIYDAIEDGIEDVGRYIARATDKGELRIDEDADISRYLDDSCELLIKGDLSLKPEQENKDND